MRVNSTVVASSFVLVASLASFHGAALAQEDGAADAAESDEKSSSLPDKEVKVGGAVVGESLAGATGFVFKQGFYTQSDLGFFFRLGGYTADQDCSDGDCGLPSVPVDTSNVQPYVGLSAGYDLFQWLGIQVSFGTGFVANAAPYGVPDIPSGDRLAFLNVPRDYGLTFLDLGVVGQYYFLDRLAVALKLQGGATLMTPEPNVGEPNLGGNALVGLGIRWASLLPDTFVGLDSNYHAVFLPTADGGMLTISGFSFAPVIKYVF